MFRENIQNTWFQTQYGSYEQKTIQNHFNKDMNDSVNTGKYKLFSNLDLDEWDISMYCESLWEPDAPVEFMPLFNYDLEEVLFRFLHSWSIVRTSDYRCIGMVNFEKLTDDSSLVSFEVTIHPDEAWEDVFPSMVRFIFERYGTKKIIAPRNNISETMKGFYEKIGMKADTETYPYRTQWGEVPMNVYSFSRADYINL